jgi:uncharacterized NAD(P)/FAD-binding protein YdhS
MPSVNGRLLELVHRLDALGPQPSLVDLAKALKEVKLTLADVQDFVQSNSRNYQRIPVVFRERYELLVMTWLPGQASVPHDHAGSMCAVNVVQGNAVESTFHIAEDGYADMQYEQRIHTGEVTAGQDGGVHSVSNPVQATDTLVSVHVYAPPLRDFRQFSRRPATTHAKPRLVRERTPAFTIVGGGFSGSMVAAQLIQRASQAGLRVKISLVERRGTIGDGPAYGTREDAHLLNVPAGKMSAWPDRPEDFLQWARRRKGDAEPTDFLPRQWYGEYVRESLLDTARAAGSMVELEVIFDEVRRVARHPAGGWMVHLGRETSRRAEGVVLAIGHRPPSDPPGLRWAGPRTRYLADPWRPFALNVVRPDDPVVILGTGLTAIDAVLSLSQQPRRAPITLVSRHGLLPQAHAATPVKPVEVQEIVSRLLGMPGGLKANSLLKAVRKKVCEVKSGGGDWRAVVDGLRPHTATLWQALSPCQRKRFLTRIRPFWEVHRHRMAVKVAEQFRTLLERGDVRLLAGRVESAQPQDDGLWLVLRKADSRLIEAQAAWIINCTGPMPSNSVESNPAIGSLLVDGWLRPDALSLGIDTTSEGNAVAADGTAVPGLFVVGTLRKPATWESTAVPELRNQAADVARNIVESLIHQQHAVAVI